MSDLPVNHLVDRLSEKLFDKKWLLSTAESCTGGMISAAITSKAGSSSVFDRGFVTYSNEAKMDMLSVSAETLAQYGAVSEQTAIEMTKGALKNSRAHIAVSVTGIAGPDGGSKDKPVGLVYIGYGLKGGVIQSTKHNFTGNREDVRTQTTKEALKHLLSIIK
ncbi:MAG: damage-inducible protein CinA [Micavibrio sp.]|nr:damage-inducible protein CinA [Micavibrio sp.]|tara:strand:+ start:1445 stop:1933 length:489 start_codon:yes stop_codon:yes gene_type:complete